MGKKLCSIKQLIRMVFFTELSKLLLDLLITQHKNRKSIYYEKLYRTMKIPIECNYKFYTHLDNAPYLKPPDG